MAIKPIFGAVDALKQNLENLSVADLKREIAERKNLLLVDIREIQETVDLGTIPGAVHAPRGMLEFWADPASPYYRDWFKEDKRIVVFCAGGGRSAFAAQALIDMGYKDVAHLDPGFNGWKKAGEPVEDVAKKSRWMRKPETDPRPPMWIGHSVLGVKDVPKSHAFFQKLGLRDVFAGDKFAILELRGGTHLIIEEADEPIERGAEAPFDLMVDDVAACHAKLVAAGLKPTKLKPGRIHDWFTIREPGGHKITVNSSHVGDQPV